MSIDSAPGSLPGKTRRTARPNVEADLSPGLREHIDQAARKIREAHSAELADVRKADRAGRLFRRMIRPGKQVGSLQETSAGSGLGVGDLAGELGGLLNDAIRAGTGLLEGSLTTLAQAWLATVNRPASGSNHGWSSASAPTPGETPQPQSPAAPPAPEMPDDTAVHAPGTPAASPEEAMLREAFAQFMPMLLSTISQGGDGYGLAEMVISLFGRPTYDQAAGLGKDKIMQLVRSEPDLWAQVAPIEAKFSRFLDEFTGYDAWTAEQVRQAHKPPEPSRRGRSKPAAANG